MIKSIVWNSSWDCFGSVMSVTTILQHVSSCWVKLLLLWVLKEYSRFLSYWGVDCLRELSVWRIGNVLAGEIFALLMTPFLVAANFNLFYEKTLWSYKRRPLWPQSAAGKRLMAHKYLTPLDENWPKQLLNSSNKNTEQCSRCYNSSGHSMTVAATKRRLVSFVQILPRLPSRCFLVLMSLPWESFISGDSGRGDCPSPFVLKKKGLFSFVWTPLTWSPTKSHSVTEQRHKPQRLLTF